MSRKILSLVAGLALASVAGAGDAGAKTTLTLKGMTCGGCVAAVRLQLKKTEGVIAYEVSLDEGEAEVTYDPAKTDPKKIAQSVSKTGFQATVKGDKTDTPAKQSVDKVELRDLRDWFNAASGSVRVVSLLSPTCPACQCGHGVLKTVFGQTDSRDLKGFIVWLPMRPGDDPASVTAEAATFRDERVAEGWDPGRQVGGSFAQALKLRGTAWDVYLVYDRGVRWGATPPSPSFWMHQLKEAAGADQKLCLDPARFAREVLGRLGTRG